ncbi:MAG: PLP-dependent aminotransferase family protein [Candidatus Cloacimonetes bacterium]|nr:PLP-dependent aminotransferase family protein [Candidatus Cloacimonadota bacterium]
MPVNFDELFSINSRRMKKSVIRELLKLTAKPEIISFAGGLPSPDSFPVEEVKEVVNEVMEKEGKIALQYSATEGDHVLRDQLIKHSHKNGMDVKEENLLVTTSSQQGLDLTAKIFIDPGDPIIVELPSYVGGLGAFNAYGAEMIGVPHDEEGKSSKLLRQELKILNDSGNKPKFIYIVPDFQNPAGMTMSLKRRHEILELAYEFDLIILEDSPYRELRFEGDPVPTIYSLDNEGRVILLGTFSKIFAPGFRVGWILAHPQVITKLVVAKQSTDLCPPTFSQRIIGRFMEKGYLDKNIDNIKKMYRKKRDIMLDAFEKYMPEGVTWTKPEGGLFLFMRVPGHMGIDTDELFYKAVDKNVAYVIGSAFHCDDSGHDAMRINFSYPTEEQIVEGVKRLATVIKEHAK